MEDLLFLMVVGAAAAAGVVVYGRRRRQRREALARLCLERGWQHVGRDDSLLQHWALDFPLFTEGEWGARCEDVVIAPHGPLTITFADFSYRESTGVDDQGNQTTSVERHAVAVATLPGSLPSLRLGKETAFSRLGRRLGMQDVEVGDAEFDRRFRVLGDPASARTLLHPVLTHLLVHQPYDSWHVAGRRLLVTRKGRWRTEEYAEVCGLLDQLVSAVPDELWDQEPADTA